MKSENTYVLVPVNFFLDWIEEKTKVNKTALETLYQKWDTTPDEAKKDILYDVIRWHKLILEALNAIKLGGITNEYEP